MDFIVSYHFGFSVLNCINPVIGIVVVMNHERDGLDLALTALVKIPAEVVRSAHNATALTLARDGRVRESDANGVHWLPSFLYVYSLAVGCDKLSCRWRLLLQPQ